MLMQDIFIPIEQNGSVCVCELLEWAQYYPHVLYGATESVCDTSIMNWFLAESKVSEFDVSF